MADSSPSLDEGGGGSEIDLGAVLQFTTEFGTNAAIFAVAIAAIRPFVTQVPAHETRINYLNSYQGTLRNRIASLQEQISAIESQEAEIERLANALANCGAESIRDAEDSEAALVGDNIPPEITGSGPS